MNLILGLIMAVIFVTVGISMLPSMNTTVAAITTPTYSVGVVGMIGVVLIVYSAMIDKTVCPRSNPRSITALNGEACNESYGNPVPMRESLDSQKCVETLRAVASYEVKEKVRTLFERISIHWSIRNPEGDAGGSLVNS